MVGYDNDQYEDGQEGEFMQALKDLNGGTGPTWVQLTKRDGGHEVRILPRYMANALLENLANGLDPSVYSAKVSPL